MAAPRDRRRRAASQQGACSAWLLRAEFSLRACRYGAGNNTETVCATPQGPARAHHCGQGQHVAWQCRHAAATRVSTTSPLCQVRDGERGQDHGGGHDGHSCLAGQVGPRPGECHASPWLCPSAAARPPPSAASPPTFCLRALSGTLQPIASYGVRPVADGPGDPPANWSLSGELAAKWPPGHRLLFVQVVRGSKRRR